MYNKKVNLGFLNPYPIVYNAIGEHMAPMANIGLSVSKPKTIENNPMHSNRLTNAVAGIVRLFILSWVAMIYLFILFVLISVLRFV